MSGDIRAKHTCRYCGRPFECSRAAYEENPNCAACLHKRIAQSVAEENSRLRAKIAKLRKRLRAFVKREPHVRVLIDFDLGGCDQPVKCEVCTAAALADAIKVMPRKKAPAAHE